jgi:A/G-specific adenine glycosylase
LAPLTHTFTHFKLDIEPRCAALSQRVGAADIEARDDDTAWVPLEQLDDYGVPAPVRKLLDALSGSLV